MPHSAKFGGKATAILLLVGVLSPVFCVATVVAAAPDVRQSAAAPSGCHHSSPAPAAPASHQKCCAPSPATKALLSARYTPPAPAIAGQTPVTALVSLQVHSIVIAETAIPASPPGLRVLRI